MRNMFRAADTDGSGELSRAVSIMHTLAKNSNIQQP